MSSDPGQFLKGLIGQSDAQVAGRDTDKYTGPGSKVKRTGGEVLSDFIFRFGNTDGLQKAAEDIYVDKLQDDYGTNYLFNKGDFRVQLERLEQFILFELSSGNKDQSKYIDLRYRNAIAVSTEKMEKAI